MHLSLSKNRRGTWRKKHELLPWRDLFGRSLEPFNLRLATILAHIHPLCIITSQIAQLLIAQNCTEELVETGRSIFFFFNEICFLYLILE